MGLPPIRTYNPGAPKSRNVQTASKLYLMLTFYESTQKPVRYPHNSPRARASSSSAARVGASYLAKSA